MPSGRKVRENEVSRRKCMSVVCPERTASQNGVTDFDISMVDALAPHDTYLMPHATLPFDVLVILLRSFDAASLACAAAVCREWRRAALHAWEAAEPSLAPCRSALLSSHHPEFRQEPGDAGPRARERAAEVELAGRWLRGALGAATLRGHTGAVVGIALVRWPLALALCLAWMALVSVRIYKNTNFVIHK